MATEDGRFGIACDIIERTSITESRQVYDASDCFEGLFDSRRLQLGFE